MKLLFFYEVYDLIKFRKMFCKKLLKLFKSKIKYMYKTRRKRSMEKYKFKNFNENTLQRSFSDYILGVDVGGTNTTFAVAGVKNNEPILLYSLNFKTKNLDSLTSAINTALDFSKEEYDIDVFYACVGAAGLVSELNNYAKLTNVRWDISAKEIIDKTNLADIFIINDFQAVGFGINFLDLNNPNDVIVIHSSNKTSKKNYQTRAVVGAGTGLGKSILVYNKALKLFIPVHSEGGHCDLPVTSSFELALIDFIKKLRNIKENVTYEEVLSGRGLEAIYLFLKEREEFRESKYTRIIDAKVDKAEYISKYRDVDETCKEVFRLFSSFYARCARNFALETMAVGGVFIAGGIAAKNKEIFSSDVFIKEFENAYRRREVLSRIPIYIVTNYNVSLYGTCLAAILKFINKKYDKI